MREHIKTIIKCLVNSIVALLAMNTIIFIIELNQFALVQDWSFKIESGTFFIKNTASGFEFGKMETTVLLLMLFVFALFLNFKRNTQDTPKMPNYWF